MEIVSNCEPWTVRRLASHALNNQLLWAGIVTGEETVSPEDTMGAVPYDGDLAQFAGEVTDRSLAMWGTDGVLDAIHVTPLGELPGSVVINFATIDALVSRVGPGGERRSPDRVRRGDDPDDLRGGRGDVHRRGTRARPHQAGGPDPGGRHRHRTAHGHGGPVHLPLSRVVCGSEIVGRG